ncbi:hypothetical protein WJX72_004230 [[Myrmecia] bisecta]|uniref:Uncharacterized protein n=1 Tax=[Myrmecia] bisecta TaxID=41462 RepID=A0AAW1P8L2_9CHLO
MSSETTEQADDAFRSLSILGDMDGIKLEEILCRLAPTLQAAKGIPYYLCNRLARPWQSSLTNWTAAPCRCSHCAGQGRHG